MGAALSIFVLLSISIFIVRLASVGLRLTGLQDASARFQALSAFTGTGFTTSEAEMIVNYPVRRRIVSLLMIIGNMGLVTVFAALVVSLVHTEGEVGAVMEQLAWLLAGLALLWFMMLNNTADRIICSVIGKFLESTTELGKRSYHRLLQIGDGYSVCEHPLKQDWSENNSDLIESDLAELDFTILAVRSSDGQLSGDHRKNGQIETAQALILFGRDEAHQNLRDQLCRIGAPR
jgi:hypothetical protein